jgi:uncharacterized protein YdhG (YjbR/CyaY superfamily)
MQDQSIKTIDDYIAGSPRCLQKTLEKIRQTIKKAAPDATEAIKYQIPTFVTPAGNLVHFAACKTHIGFYPSPSGIEKFKEEFAAYKTSKGAVQFPLDSNIPFDLIKRVVEYRLREASQINNRASCKKRR